MTPQDPSRDDARLADLLATLDATSAPPDEATLARLRAETAQVFSPSSKYPPSEITPPPLIPGGRRRRMYRFAVVAVAAALMFGLAIVSWMTPRAGPSLA